MSPTRIERELSACSHLSTEALRTGLGTTQRYNTAHSETTAAAAAAAAHHGHDQRAPQTDGCCQRARSAARTHPLQCNRRRSQWATNSCGRGWSRGGGGAGSGRGGRRGHGRGREFMEGVTRVGEVRVSAPQASCGEASGFGHVRGALGYSDAASPGASGPTRAAAVAQNKPSVWQQYATA